MHRVDRSTRTPAQSTTVDSERTAATDVTVSTSTAVDRGGSTATVAAVSAAATTPTDSDDAQPRPTPTTCSPSCSRRRCREPARLSLVVTMSCFCYGGQGDPLIRVQHGQHAVQRSCVRWLRNVTRIEPGSAAAATATATFATTTATLAADCPADEDLTGSVELKL